MSMTEFTIHMSNRPGQLAALAQVLATAGVNIEALAVFGVEELGVVRLVVSDPDAARRALSEGGLPFDERTVLLTTLPHEPGRLAEMTRKLADAGVNIDGLYVLRSRPEGLELAMAVSDTTEAESALGTAATPA